jgi:phospholipid/cholesterol/gamma-HCH transport system permease protein
VTTDNVGQAAEVSSQASTTGHAAGVSNIISDLGKIVVFSGRVLGSLPAALGYPSEILRQIGILVATSASIVWFMMVILAAEISLEAHYLTESLGVSSYSAVVDAVGYAVDTPEMWGWILAAKIGCGLVAELGSMRISDEIDALEVMGINPMSYLVGTRVVAISVFTPFMFLVGSASMFLLNRFMAVDFYGSVSSGGHHAVFWTFLSSWDILLSLVSSLIIGTIIVLVGCYYGYSAEGGPVGVGYNTAKSMIINMITVSVIGSLCWQLFEGGFARIPIAN